MLFNTVAAPFWSIIKVFQMTPNIVMCELDLTYLKTPVFAYLHGQCLGSISEVLHTVTLCEDPQLS